MRAKKEHSDKSLQINGQDLDAWIDSESGEGNVSSAEDASPTYDKKLVAFLDLLGITNQIRSLRNGEEKQIISVMERIRGIVGIEVDSMPEIDSITMLYISDSFIFVCDTEQLPYFLRLLSNIQMRILVECHTMLRGALEFGEVIIRDEGKQIIGPAYIDAYLKQEKHAIFPRIIIGNSVLELINAQKYAAIITSRDREISLDYLDIYMELEGKNKTEIIARLRREGVYDYLSQGYVEYDKKDNPSVRSKFAWTINYLKEKGVWPNEKQYRCWQELA